MLNRTGEEGFVTAYINTQMLEVEVGGTAFRRYLEIAKIVTLAPLKTLTIMFHQVIGSPANAFIIIVAVVVGFVSAIAYLDARKKFKDNEDNAPRFDEKK